ncbi:unnamed protein product [Adineta steineri]|uniref:Uncharacterized protein n=1 Tax=Adineta steineri TaxID=433720 RepID=A0A819JMC9_9BILA|nr:unnamed protein product [Adineta steineri]CAF1358804.1 unnamed protein product [Adineta steineri]CAF3862242.1 unnamed protein product [Adineta steineri]CAF3936215.1 unnamed protein product [Adineta steineri]
MQDELEQEEQIAHIELLQEDEEQIQLEQWEQHGTIEIQDPYILAYISQLKDEIQQLRQMDALQTMDNEMIEEPNQERTDQEILQIEECDALVLQSQIMNEH